MNGKAIAVLGAGGLFLYFLSQNQDRPKPEPVPQGQNIVSGENPPPPIDAPEKPEEPSKAPGVPETPAIKPTNDTIFDLQLINVNQEHSKFFYDYFGNPRYRFFGTVKMANVSGKSVNLKKLIIASPYLAVSERIFNTGFGSTWEPSESREIEVEKEFMAYDSAGKELTRDQILKSITFKAIV